MKNILINGYNSFLANNFYKKFKTKYNIVYYKNDINDLNSFKSIIKNKKIDHIIHFAALTRSKCIVNKIICKKTNYHAVVRIIDFLNTIKNKPKFIFISSSHVYDYSNLKIRERFKTKPRDLYGKLKLKSELYIKHNYINYTILRLFNVYGEYQSKFHFIPDIFFKIKNNKIIKINKSIRDFINVDEVSQIISFVIKKNIISTINVGSGEGKSLLSVIKFIANKININPKIRLVNKSDKIVANINKLKLLGYKFTINEKNFNF